MTSILLPIGLAFIMLAVGLGLTPVAFGRIKERPAALGWGLAAQVFALPAIAFAIASLIGLSPTMSVGLMILAAAPGGITSNFLTMLARGDTALSITLTVITSLLAIATVPVVVAIALGFFAGEAATIRLPVGHTVLAILLITALPLIAGMALRVRFPSLTHRAVPTARRLATAIFAAIVVGAFWGQWNDIERHWQDVGPAVVLLNLVTMALGFGIAAMLRLDIRQSIAIAVECGLQNVALAIFVAVTLIGVQSLMIPAVIYALVMNVSVFAVIFVGRWLIPDMEEGTVRLR